FLCNPAAKTTQIAGSWRMAAPAGDLAFSLEINNLGRSRKFREESIPTLKIRVSVVRFRPWPPTVEAQSVSVGLCSSGIA
ncbi:MAG: hypothetical protein JSW36_03665, partial [Burkholderiales bacterium]